MRSLQNWLISLLPLLSDISPDPTKDIHRKEARLLAFGFAFLVLSAVSIWLARVIRAPGEFDPLGSLAHGLLLVVWAAGAWFAHREAGKLRPFRDPLLLPLGLLLAGWGALLVWRLSAGLGLRQVGWFALGLAMLIAILHSPPDLSWLRRYKYLWLSIGLLLTGLTLFFGTHPAGGEPRLWLGCCGIYLQPSEPLRLLLLAFVASYLADRILAGWAGDQRRRSLAMAALLAAWGIAGLLLAAQRDLGMATLFLVLFTLLTYIASGRTVILVAAFALACVGGLAGAQLIDLVRTRAAAWLDPWADPTGNGYQLVQSLIAIAWGGVFGTGPGMGSPHLVPVVQSDFIFAAVMEEWGMIGGLAMIVLLAVLVARGLRIAAHSQEPFSMLLSAGVAVAFGSQAILILGGVVRLLPITGVTLPFVSYGGSSLITSFIGLGILLVLSQEGSSKSGGFSLQIYTIQRLMSVAWILIAFAVGWWVLYRGETLQLRTDNLRRAFVSSNSLRGAIRDRNDRLLALSVGRPGDYRRQVLAPEAVSSVGYDSGAFGQAGVELSMDGYLRGELGPEPLQVAWTKLLRGVPPSGYQVRLTIDLDLQAAAMGALKGSRGALVAIDPTSGDILAMASAPGFDPNTLDEEWADLIERSDAPLLNRAAQSRYQPGMVLEPFLYAWALEHGYIQAQQPIESLGEAVSLEEQQLSCLFEVPLGQAETLDTALEWACPGPFANLGERIGADGLEAMLAAFGFNRTAEIRLATADPIGLEIPSDAQSVRWAAIGQGDLLISPLHVGRAFSALASGGLRPALSLVDAVGSRDGDWERLQALGIEESVLSPRSAQTTLQAMGLYEDSRVDYSAEALSGPEGGKLAWYLGARVAAGPRMVVVVVLEDGTVELAEQIGRGLVDAR